MKEVAFKLFDACETGKGWSECAPYCHESATFHCDVLPMKTMKDYSDWMKGVLVIAPDAKYEVLSCTTNDTQVVYCAIFTATHTGEGGPVKPSDPPKKTACDYAYIIDFKEGKVSHMRKIFDKLTGFSKLGWPLD
eukprot:CAMPEP_0170525934 /NCGR_PEP_ID=MMETSP0209-20121228/11385_1 /TAXON_ID=665100 ORGANISM="Litonotus pictus, Strain P1" /NCGR_SAMPLE_ID=MMETSP0209 /ASSEMBLY_ACC=CAM_ASM_000301 /LENGTH=134 /DNA_ID=CAMNT_0010815469 /DNA_START=36 /DNA_END=440 /DNA_ORIENTATION=+